MLAFLYGNCVARHTFETMLAGANDVAIGSISRLSDIRGSA